MAAAIIPLRGLLRSKFPNLNNGIYIYTTFFSFLPTILYLHVERDYICCNFYHFFLGALGSNLPQILERFLAGARLSIKADPVHPMWGLASPIIGRVKFIKS